MSLSSTLEAFSREDHPIMRYLKNGSLSLALREFERTGTKGLKGKDALEAARLFLNLSMKGDLDTRKKGLLAGIELLKTPMPLVLRQEASILKGKICLE